MAAVIDATPGGVSSNSFATVAYADAYFDRRLYGEFWQPVLADQKIRALITATRLIVEASNSAGWQGNLMSPTQRLPFPRTGVYAPDGWHLLPVGVIPEALADATAEYAGRLIELERMPDTILETEGIKKLVAGSVEVEYFGGGSYSTDLPEAIYNMISFLFARSIGRTSVPLIRT